MTFKEAKQLLNKMDFEKFNKRYKNDNKYVLMGCEGRFIKKKDWDNNVSIIHKNELYLNKNYERVLFEKVPTYINIGKTFSKNKCNDDYYVEDRIPGDIVILNSINDTGIWGV